MSSRLTIKDIAAHFGVGVGVISRAVNNSGYVRKELREAIMAFVRENHWQPSTSAAALKRGSSGIVGLLLGHAPTPFFTLLFHRFEGSKYRLQSVLDSSVETLDRMIAEQVEAILICGAHQNHYDAIRRAIALGIPVMGIFGHENFFPTAWSDHRGGMKECIRRLAEAGHRKIGYIGGFLPADPGTFDSRRYEYMATRGLLEGMVECGIDFMPERDIIATSLSDWKRPEELYPALREKRHTALLIWGNSALLGVYVACRKLGISIPGDLSLCSLEGHDLTEVMNPPPEFWSRDYDEYAALAERFVLSRGAEVSGQYCVKFHHVPGESIRAVN